MIRLSLVIPAYNVAPWIEATLLSVCSNQDIDLQTVEVLVVNDGSTDATQQVVEDFIRTHTDLSVRLVNQTNQGVSAARNNGLHQAQGEYVWFVDGDDLITPYAIQGIYGIIDSNPDVNVVRTAKPIKFCGTSPENSDCPKEGRTKCCKAYELFNETYSGVYNCHIRHIWRRVFLEQCGLEYPAGITTHEDLCFTIQCILNAETACDAPWLEAYLIRMREGSATDIRKTPDLFQKNIVSAQKALEITLHSISQKIQSLGEKDREEIMAYRRVCNLMCATNVTHVLDPQPLPFVRRSLRRLEQMGAYPFTPERDHSWLLRFVMKRRWAIYAVSQYRRIIQSEFIRFCLVGGIAFCVHYGVYLLLLHVFHTDSEWWTNVFFSIGYGISFCCNLWLTAHFTFRDTINVKRGIGFAACHAVNYGLNIAFLNLYLWLGVPEQWVPIPVLCTASPINFILVRTVFKLKRFQS